ncbi:hypothetical protein MKEN_01346800 [Mycena kentingensis (nom. inval.)]|nr:hypothetical protein MKEN_01346800 [Mycena kentingensis (nom. inval.)]
MWGQSALTTLTGLGRGSNCAEALCAMARAYICDHTELPENPYGGWKESMMADEDLASAANVYLLSLGKNITAGKFLDFFHDPEVRAEHGIDKKISLSTACRYLDDLGYRFSAPKKG